MATLRAQALATRDVQVLHRPRTRGQGPRRGGSLPEPTREGRRALRGREVPDTSTRPHGAHPSAATGTTQKATHDDKRNGTTTLFAALEVATGKVTDHCYDRHGKAEFADFLKKVARAESCTSWWSPTTPTSAPRSRPSSRSTRASRCTSPRPQARGSTSSKCSSASSPDKPFGAAPSPA